MDAVAVLWANLASDASGIALFLLWLAIPPAYMFLLGRQYVRRCRDELDRTRLYVDDNLLARQQEESIVENHGHRDVHAASMDV